MQSLRGSLCYHNTANEATHCSQSKLYLQLAPAHDFLNFMNLSHNLSRYQSPSESSESMFLELLLAACQFPAAGRHAQLPGEAVTHRAGQPCPPSSTKRQGKAAQASHAPALTHFPKNYSVPSCCPQPVTLPSFPPIHGPPLLQSSSPFEQFWLILLQPSQLFTTKRIS